MQCRCHQQHNKKIYNHLNQILKINKNYRFERAFEDFLETITFKIQQIIIVKNVQNDVSPAVESNELISMKNIIEYILESAIRVNLSNILF